VKHGSPLAQVLPTCCPIHHHILYVSNLQAAAHTHTASKALRVQPEPCIPNPSTTTSSMWPTCRQQRTIQSQSLG
jgi:hypothetical protein